jgi:hypothetical protein
MRVLRIESITGEGLYGYGNYKDSLAFRLGMDMGCYPHRPAPDNDGLWGLIDTRDHYGFSTTSQLINWMDDINPEDIYAKGGVIVEVEVSEIERGRKQCRFDIKNLISKKPLTLDEFYDKLYA